MFVPSPSANLGMATLLPGRLSVKQPNITPPNQNVSCQQCKHYELRLLLWVSTRASQTKLFWMRLKCEDLIDEVQHDVWG